MPVGKVVIIARQNCVSLGNSSSLSHDHPRVPSRTILDSSGKAGEREKEKIGQGPAAITPRQL